MVAVDNKKTAPLPREAIDTIDSLLAKYLLLAELCQTVEFVYLWQDARRIPSQVIEIMRPSLDKLSEEFEAMSAEGRGAFLMGEKAYSLYDVITVNEAEAAAIKLHSLSKTVDEALQKAGKEMTSAKNHVHEEAGPCPECGKPLVKRWSKRGAFLGCSGFPECKHTQPMEGEARPQAKPTEHKCEKCGGTMLLRLNGRGEPFLGCENFPKCRSTLPCDAEGNPIKPEPTGEVCDKCGAEMVVKRGRRGPFLACSAANKSPTVGLSNWPPSRINFTSSASRVSYFSRAFAIRSSLSLFASINSFAFLYASSAIFFTSPSIVSAVLSEYSLSPGITYIISLSPESGP